MEQKAKFIIVGLAVFSIACLFLFAQATNQKQTLLRESNDLKSENAALLSKVNRLENDLRENQSKLDSLKGQRDKWSEELGNLEKKYESVVKVRDELIEKLRRQNQPQQETAVTQPQVAAAAVSNDAYWGQILKAKTDLEIQLTNLRADLRSLQISNESLQREKSVLGLDINNLRNEKKDLLRQLDYNQKLLDSISQEAVREKNDKTGIQDTFKRLKAENEILSRQLKSLSGRKIVLDQKVQSLQEGKSAVEKRLSEMEAMLTARISQIGSLKSELDAIKSGRPAPVLEKKRESVELPAIIVRSSPYLEKEEGPLFIGKILAVNTDNNFVIIDAGVSSGARVGDVFNVYRSGKSIGSIAVIQIRDNISACDIKRTSVPLKIGDNIR